MGGVRRYYNTSGLVRLVPDVFRSSYCDHRRKARIYTHDLSADLCSCITLLLFLLYILLSLQCIILYYIPLLYRSTSVVVNLVAGRGVRYSVYYTVYVWDYIVYSVIRQVCSPPFYCLVIKYLGYNSDFWKI